MRTSLLRSRLRSLPNTLAGGKAGGASAEASSSARPPYSKGGEGGESSVSRFREFAEILPVPFLPWFLACQLRDSPDGNRDFCFFATLHQVRQIPAWRRQSSTYLGFNTAVAFLFFLIASAVTSIACRDLPFAACFAGFFPLCYCITASVHVRKIVNRN